MTERGKYYTRADEQQQQQQRNRAKRRKYDHDYYLKKKGKSQDSPDRKVPLMTRQPEWLVARLQRIAAEGLVTGKYPCKTVSEALTWIASTGLSALKDDPVVGDEMKFVAAKQSIDRINKVRREAMGLLHTASTEVSELVAIGAIDEATQYFSSAITAIRGLPKTVWLDEAIRKFEERFPQIAKRKVPGLKMHFDDKRKPRA